MDDILHHSHHSIISIHLNPLHQLIHPLLWEKRCHKPPMTGNGNHTTYKDGDDWGMVYCFTHINPYKHYPLVI
jgi:hypothetical protein